MRFLHTTYLIFISLFILSSCSYKQSQVLFGKKDTKKVTQKVAKKNGKKTAVPDSVLAKQNITNVSIYRIKPQDILQIRNLQNSKNIVDLTPLATTTGTATNTQPETFLVEDDGTIGLTGLGRVQVAGLTRLEANNKIEDLYKEKVVKDPIIEVKILNLKVTVTGEVKTPGNYQLTKDRTTLIDILGTAGWLTDKANEKDIQIIRSNQANPIVIHVDLSDLKTANDPKTILQNDDLIKVGLNSKNIRSEQLQNFQTVIQPILIVLSALVVILSLTKK